MKKTSNKRLNRTNIRCHLLCKDTHKSRHQTFARLAGRYALLRNAFAENGGVRKISV